MKSSARRLGGSYFRDVRLYLYHSEDEALERAGKSARNAILAYLRELVEVCGECFGPHARDEPLDIVAGLRPHYRSKVWLVSSRDWGDPCLQLLRRRLEFVPPPHVAASCLLVVAVSGAFGEALPRWREHGESYFPWPGEWMDVPNSMKETFDDLICAAWPISIKRVSRLVQEELGTLGLGPLADEGVEHKRSKLSDHGVDPPEK